MSVAPFFPPPQTLSQNRSKPPQEDGFALVPLLVLLILLGSITTIMMIEAVSATRHTEAARRGRRLDTERRTAAVTEVRNHSTRSLSISPLAPAYQIIRFHRGAFTPSGIPFSRYLDGSLPCPTSSADPIATSVCTEISFTPGSLTNVSGGLNTPSLTVPATTRALYVRGTVRIGSLAILGPSLTISALGSITIGSTSSPRSSSPTLLLLSRIGQYQASSTKPGGTAVVPGTSPLAASLIDTSIFPQPQSTIMGMRFPGG